MRNLLVCAGEGRRRKECNKSVQVAERSDRCGSECTCAGPGAARAHRCSVQRARGAGARRWLQLEGHPAPSDRAPIHCQQTPNEWKWGRRRRRDGASHYSLHHLSNASASGLIDDTSPSIDIDLWHVVRILFFFFTYSMSYFRSIIFCTN